MAHRNTVEVPCEECGKVRHHRDGDNPTSRLCLGCLRRARPKRPLKERFLEKLQWGPAPAHKPELGPCLLFVGEGNLPVGKPARIGLGGRGAGVVTAHRYAFFLAFGRWPVPNANHHCDVPNCCKAIADEHGPAHIFEGTQKANIQDMASKGRSKFGQRGQSLKTHCPRGHEYTPENTYWTTRKSGPSIGGKSRSCIICRKTVINPALKGGALDLA